MGETGLGQMAPAGRRDGSQLSGSRSRKERGAARNKAIAAGLKIESVNGDLHLANRIAMAPLTRNRADRTYTPTDMMVEHYAQRAAVPGTLLITESSYITPKDAAFFLRATPGIWSDEQIAAWKKVRRSWVFT